MEVTGLTVVVVRDDDGQILEVAVCATPEIAEKVIAGVNALGGDTASVQASDARVIASETEASEYVGTFRDDLIEALVESVASEYSITSARLQVLFDDERDEDGWPRMYALTAHEQFALSTLDEEVEKAIPGYPEAAHGPS